MLILSITDEQNQPIIKSSNLLGFLKILLAELVSNKFINLRAGMVCTGNAEYPLSFEKIKAYAHEKGFKISKFFS